MSYPRQSSANAYQIVSSSLACNCQLFVIPLYSTKRSCFIPCVVGQPVAIYRDDLPSDYVAYWLVEFNASQYIALSSGSKTGMLDDRYVR